MIKNNNLALYLSSFVKVNLNKIIKINDYFYLFFVLKFNYS